MEKETIIVDSMEMLAIQQTVVVARMLGGNRVGEKTLEVMQSILEQCQVRAFQGLLKKIDSNAMEFQLDANETYVLNELMEDLVKQNALTEEGAPLVQSVLNKLSPLVANISKPLN